MFANQGRLVLLASLVKLRLVGWPPWLFLGLWSVTAAVGEPFVLRTFGVSLHTQATWAGGTVLTAILLLVGRRPLDLVPRLTTSALVVVAMSALLGGLSLSLEVAFGYDTTLACFAKQAVCFTIAWLPVAAASCLPNATQIIYRQVFITASIMLGVAMSVQASGFAVGGAEVLATALSLGACLFLVACCSPTAMISNRP